MNGTPDEVLQNREFMQFILPSLRADLTLCDGYEYMPEPPLNCPLSSYGGIDDYDPVPETLAAWREETSRAHQVRLFPGGHLFIHDCTAALIGAVAGEFSAAAGNV
jgi:medium-chain acyl-[acyl-carrier-protein] hydrolase